MKITVKDNTPKNPEREYPYLGKLQKHDFVVLFISPGVGVRLNGEDKCVYSDCWAEDSFVPFQGQIILSN